MNTPSRFLAHPWHGISPGEDCPHEVNAFIEIVPTDTVKYEVDKVSGHVKVDRPQKFSSLPPALYGFVPQTYCAEAVAACGTQSSQADGDPMDICVISERPILHGAILLKAIPIGGLRMIDRGEADDKIIAVLKGDALFGAWRDIKDCHPSLLDRIHHYFLTYKDMPGGEKKRVEISDIYGVDGAHRVIAASITDYQTHFPA